MVLAALTPFLVLTSAIPPLDKLISADVGLGSTGMEMSAGKADAAYCFGTILAVQLTTSLMLITAAPALVLGFPTPRLRSTAMVMNMGIFGFLTFSDMPPMDREIEFDFESLALASVGCPAAFSPTRHSSRIR